MKKILFMSAAFALLGGACVTVEITGNTISVPVDDAVLAGKATSVGHVEWEADAFLDCVVLHPSQDLASQLGYPAGATDHLCASAETEALLSDRSDVNDSGEAEVVLANVELTNPGHEDSGNIYQVDILEVLNATK